VQLLVCRFGMDFSLGSNTGAVSGNARIRPVKELAGIGLDFVSSLTPADYNSYWAPCECDVPQARSAHK